jgi:hypothetical protein
VGRILKGARTLLSAAWNSGLRVRAPLGNVTPAASRWIRSHHPAVLARRSSVLARRSSVLARRSLVLARHFFVLARRSSVLARRFSELARRSSVLARRSSVPARSSSVLAHSPCVLAHKACAGPQRPFVGCRRLKVSHFGTFGWVSGHIRQGSGSAPAWKEQGKPSLFGNSGRVRLAPWLNPCL